MTVLAMVVGVAAAAMPLPLLAVLRPLLGPAAGIIIAVANLYCLLVFVWALMSWFDHSKGFMKDVYQAIDTIVSPYVNIFRRFIKPVGGLDLSPFVALLVLQLVIRLLI
ncbi:MAG: YggT family protein [Actinomycetia bacterium]|nr:YggT family protein [Actinomycetes bacterium]